jgi:hypothetical protein
VHANFVPILQRLALEEVVDAGAPRRAAIS